MTASLVIALRESLETVLILSVMLTFLQRIHADRSKRWVWAGLCAGITASALFGVLLQTSLAGMPATWRSIAEGIVMILASVFVGWMTIWMTGKSRGMRTDIEQELSGHVIQGKAAGIFLMSFLSTFREGSELVIMVQAAILSGVKVLHALSGVLTGIAGATLLGWCLFQGMRKISLRHFFAVTGIVLLFVGTGLSMRGARLLSTERGVHEASSEGENWMGELLEVSLGSSEMPTPFQAASGILYLSIVGGAWYRAGRKSA